MEINLRHPSNFGKFFILAIIALCVLAIIQSCISEKRRQRICQTCALQTITKDSVVIKEKQVQVKIHDTIPYWLPNPCAKLCDSLGRLRTDFKEEIKSDKGTKVELYTKDNELHITDELDSLKATAKIQDTTRWHEVIKEVPARCNLEHVTWWDKFWIKCGRVCLPLVLLWCAWQGFRYYRKWHLP